MQQMGLANKICKKRNISPRNLLFFCRLNQNYENEEFYNLGSIIDQGHSEMELIDMLSGIPWSRNVIKNDLSFRMGKYYIIHLQHTEKNKMI